MDGVENIEIKIFSIYCYDNFHLKCTLFDAVALDDLKFIRAIVIVFLKL